MKNRNKGNEFNIILDNKNYTINITETTTKENKKSMPNTLVYTCMTFEADMTPYKRFTIVFNRQDRSYWAWTGDVIREHDREFRENIAKLLSEGVLKLVS